MVQQYKGYYAAVSAKLRRRQIPVGPARTGCGRWYMKCLTIEICTCYERDMNGHCTRNERHVRVMNYHVRLMYARLGNVRAMNG